MPPARRRTSTTAPAEETAATEPVAEPAPADAPAEPAPVDDTAPVQPREDNVARDAVLAPTAAPGDTDALDTEGDYACVVEQQTEHGGYVLLNDYTRASSARTAAEREAGERHATCRVRRQDTGQVLTAYVFDPATGEVTRQDA